MTLVALAFVLVPLLRTPAGSGPSRVAANLEILRGHRREIDADVANGTLPADARDEALAELVGRAESDLTAPAPPPAARRKPWIVAGIVAIAVPALAVGMYLAVGNPSASDAAAVAAVEATRAPPSEAQMVAMVETLALKMRERPDDAQGWALLARSMAALGRFPESAAAYEHLVKLAPGDAQVLADYADSLGMAQGRKLRGRPYELVREALRIDPRNQKALALAGTAAAEVGDFAGAIGHWQRLAAELPPDSPDHAQLQAIIGEIRDRAAASGKALPAAPAVAQAPAATAATSVSGSVSLAPAMAPGVTGGETLFIFARAESGPRIPLAVLRKSARELPLQFALDDTLAMAPGMTISSAASVRIEARISKSGNAIPQPGDLVGTSAPVKPGARDVRIVVDKVVP
jgi:cytochrome c-type biogenesis protein CcmH